MEIYKKTVKLEESVPASSIIRMMQDAVGEHNRQSGLSRQILREKGLFWIIVSTYLKIERYPEPGEEIQVYSWPGSKKRRLLPRYCQGRDKKGELVFSGSALWAMLSLKSHKMVNPGSFGLITEGMVTGQECRLPAIIKPEQTQHESRFTVPEAYIDVNRHMNNTYYFDVCEHCLGDELRGRKLKEAVIDYISEARLGDEIKLSWSERAGKIYVQGENLNPIFRTELIYE